VSTLLTLTGFTYHHFGPIDLQLGAGGSTGLHGESGAGKSLLLRAIADLDEHGGKLTLDNQDCSDVPPNQWRQHIAYFASESFWWADTVGEHFTASNAHDLNTLGFDNDVLNWRVHRLSSGERQRLALLRGLQTQPQVLLLDEPSANLDSVNRDRVEKLVATYLNSHGATALWVSHDRDQLARCCQQTRQLHQGRFIT
jgi:ABC-type iron transport system FetAB ATPase subunit